MIAQAKQANIIKINGSEKKVCKKYIVISYKLGFSDIGIT